MSEQFEHTKPTDKANEVEKKATQKESRENFTAEQQARRYSENFTSLEVFADTYAHATGFPTKNERSRLIKQYFGNTLKYMKENVHV